jgi:hypothetical protein
VPSLQAARPGLGITAFPLLQAKDKTSEVSSSPDAADAIWWNAAALEGTDQDDDRPYPVSRAQAAAEIRAERKAAKKELRLLFSKARDEEAERRRVMFPWPRETHWWQCLVYPIRAWKMLLGLSVAWSLTTGLLMGFLAEHLEQKGWKVLALALMLALPLFGYTWAFFRCTLISASQGEAGIVSVPGRDTVWAGGSTCLGLICSLAGPVVPIVVAVLFWLNSGDLLLIDWLILEELATLAVAHWVLALAACQVGGRPWDAGPAGIVQLVRRLGWKTTAGVFLASAPAAAFALVGLSMLEYPTPKGWLVISLCWVGGLSWLVFLLRWLGLACFRVRKKRPLPSGQVEVVDGWGGLEEFPANAI